MSDIQKGSLKMEEPVFAAIILAAGYSSRMKKFKPLLPIEGTTALERLAASVRAGGIEKLVVVTGHRREQLEPVLEKIGAIEAYNENYDDGMFSSIKMGIRRAAELYSDAAGFFLVPVDCPLIDNGVIRKMLGKIVAGTGENRSDFYVPVFEGKKGHPLYIPGEYADEISRYEGGGGLKAVTDRHWDRMVRIPVDDEGCLLDMDTLEGYAEIQEFLKAGRRREDVVSLAEGRRIFLVRHGQTRQHREKMFIGRYDVPLSDEGMKQMIRTAKEIARLRPETEVIYTSDLTRAVQSAEILSRQFRSDRQLPMRLELSRRLREISLGPWDGRPVREIREKYPEQYARRGQDIFTFKTGNGAENFYDMQYRAVKELRRILKEDDNRDVVIVSHSGVIRALENNLRGIRVDDSWESLSKGDFRVVEILR